MLTEARKLTTADAFSNLLTAAGLTDMAVTELSPLAELQALKLVQAILKNPNHPLEVEQFLSKHPIAIIRVLIARFTSDASILYELSADRIVNVRESVAFNRNTSLTTLKALIEWDEFGRVRLAAARNVTLRFVDSDPSTRRLLDRLNDDPRAFVRQAAAWAFDAAATENQAAICERQFHGYYAESDGLDTINDDIPTDSESYALPFAVLPDDTDTLSPREDREEIMLYAGNYEAVPELDPLDVPEDLVGKVSEFEARFIASLNTDAEGTIES